MTAAHPAGHSAEFHQLVVALLHSLGRGQPQVLLGRSGLAQLWAAATVPVLRFLAAMAGAAARRPWPRLHRTLPTARLMFLLPGLSPRLPVLRRRLRSVSAAPTHLLWMSSPTGLASCGSSLSCRRSRSDALPVQLHLSLHMAKAIAVLLVRRGSAASTAQAMGMGTGMRRSRQHLAVVLAARSRRCCSQRLCRG